MSLLVLTFWIYFQTQEATESPKPWQTQSLKRSLCSVHERCQLSKRKEYPISHSLNPKGRNSQFLMPSSSTKSNCCGASRRDSFRLPLLPLLSVPLSHSHVNTSAPGSMPSLTGDKRWARHAAILEMLASRGERWVQKVKVRVPTVICIKTCGVFKGRKVTPGRGPGKAL